MRGLHAFGDHFQPIQILIAPLYRIYPSVLWLLLLQVIAISWGALIIHRIALRQLPNHHLVAFVIAVVYLINPVVHNPLLWQYHTLVLALPLYLLWIEAYLDRNDKHFFLLLILLLLIREDVPITTLCFGLIAFVHRRWRLGMITVFLSLTWGLFVSQVAMPYFNGEGYFRHEEGTVGVLLAHLFDPQYYVQRIWQDGDVREYLAYIFLPLILLPLRSPLWLLPAIPSLLANILIGGYNTQIGYHYSVNALPFVFVAAVMSLRLILRATPRLAPWAVAGLLTITVLSCLAGSRFSLRYVTNDLRAWETLSPMRTRLAKYDKALGQDAGIAASDFLLPHLANRKRIYLFPNPWVVHYWGIRGEHPHHPNEIDYLFLNPEQRWQQSVLLSYLQNEGFFTTEYRDERVWILRRLSLEPVNRATAVEAALGYRVPDVDGMEFGPPRLSPVFPHTKDGLKASPFVPTDDPPPTHWQQAPLWGGALFELDLAELSPGVHFATRYIYLPIVAEEVTETMLLLGSDDTLEVWFEGEKVLKSLTPRPARLGDNRLSLQLRQGVNHLYLRVDNLGGAWRLLAELKPIRSQ